MSTLIACAALAVSLLALWRTRKSAPPALFMAGDAEPAPLHPSGGLPILVNVSMAGADGDAAIRAIAADAVRQGLDRVPEITRQHGLRFLP